MMVRQTTNLFLQRCRKLISLIGNWIGIVPLPKERNIESLATSLEEGEDRDQFLDFIRGLLRWLPEERLNSYEAFTHPWISGP